MSDDGCTEHTCPHHGERNRARAVDEPLCPDCGKPADTFSCKIRHIAVNVENLKRDRER